MSMRKAYDHHFMRSIELDDEDVKALQIIAEGGTRKDIAAEVFIGEKAVDYRLSRICDRIGAVSIPNAIAICITKGIIKIKV